MVLWAPARASMPDGEIISLDSSGRVDSLKPMRGYFVAIPTYWTYPRGKGPEEIVFDHPHAPGHLGDAAPDPGELNPLAAAGVEVEVSVVAAATAPALEAAVEDRVREVIESPPLPYPVKLFAASHLLTLQDFCRTGAGGVAALAVSGRLCPDSQPDPDSRQYSAMPGHCLAWTTTR